MRVLRALGCEVSMPGGWQCCGLVAANAGDAAAAKPLLKETITALERDGAPIVVSTSTSCATMLLQDGPYLLRDEPEWEKRAQAVAARVADFARFVDGALRNDEGGTMNDELDEAGRASSFIAHRSSLQEPVTYHDPCQSANCLGLGPEARRLLVEVCGLELRELPESNVCCGFGGTFSLEHPDVAKQILARKLANVEATGAAQVVMDNPGCLMHIRGGLRAAGCPQRARHLAEIMAGQIPAGREDR